MLFLLETRKAWIRTSTHTIVFDHEPAFDTLHADPTGRLHTLHRVWLAEQRSGGAVARDYLGSFFDGLESRTRRDLCGLFRRASASARAARLPVRATRRRLAAFLREKLRSSD